MTPSLPIELPRGSTFIEVAEPLECAMLRFDRPCCNDAYYAFVCPEGWRQRIIAICQMCMDDSGEYRGKTWVMWIEELAASGQLRIG